MRCGVFFADARARTAAQLPLKAGPAGPPFEPEPAPAQLMLGREHTQRLARAGARRERPVRAGQRAGLDRRGGDVARRSRRGQRQHACFGLASQRAVVRRHAAPSRAPPRAAARRVRRRFPRSRCGGSPATAAGRFRCASRWRNGRRRARAGSRSCRCTAAADCRRRKDRRPALRAAHRARPVRAEAAGSGCAGCVSLRLRASPPEDRDTASARTPTARVHRRARGGDRRPGRPWRAITASSPCPLASGNSRRDSRTVHSTRAVNGWPARANACLRKP